MLPSRIPEKMLTPISSTSPTREPGSAFAPPGAGSDFPRKSITGTAASCFMYPVSSTRTNLFPTSFSSMAIGATCDKALRITGSTGKSKTRARMSFWCCRNWPKTQPIPIPANFHKKTCLRLSCRRRRKCCRKSLGRSIGGHWTQAPIILVAFSGGYKPLACVLDRGGTGPRIRGVLLLDALYEDLYIFGKWLLDRSGGSFFVNIFTEGSTCEEKTGILARFLREHRVPFREEWPKAPARQRIYLVRSSSEHLQVPVEGPPRTPLAAVLRSLKM